MPRGENFKGPFKGLPSVAGVVALVPCDTCSEGGKIIYKPLRVNTHGKLIANCPNVLPRCGGREEAGGMAHARSMIKRARLWKAGSKKRAYEIAGLDLPSGKDEGEVYKIPSKKPEIKPEPKKQKMQVVGLFGVRTK